MGEGYTKYQLIHEASALPEKADVDDLLWLRNALFDQEWIGFDYNLQVGFGNVSARGDEDGFLITGTQTGKRYPLSRKDISLVTRADIPANRIVCAGPVAASSEALTHAAVYEVLPEVSFVVHIHDLRAWETAILTIPTTSFSVEYGTPAMGQEVKRIIAGMGSPNEGVIAMGGHKEGLLAWGREARDLFSFLVAHMTDLSGPLS